MLAETGPGLIGFGPSWSSSAHFWPSSARIWPTPPEWSRSPVRVGRLTPKPADANPHVGGRVCNDLNRILRELGWDRAESEPKSGCLFGGNFSGSNRRMWGEHMCFGWNLGINSILGGGSEGNATASHVKPYEKVTRVAS